MLLTLTLVLGSALFGAAQQPQRTTLKPPMPGYGLVPALPRTPHSEVQTGIALSAHLMRAPRDQDQRQVRIDWLRTHSARVQGVLPWPTGREDFSDLAALGEAIQGKRIVTLGEASHSDGAAFQIKARLVRYLYQEHGFDLLVFESGLFDCDAAWRLALEGEPLEEVGLAALQPVWSQSETVRELFAWMQDTLETDRPLQLAGMDLMPTSPYMGQAHGELLRIGTRLGLDAELLAEGLEILANFPRGYQRSLGAGDEERGFQLAGMAEVATALRSAGRELPSKHALRERAEFHAQFLSSLGKAITMIALTDWSNPEGDSNLNLRDEQMAANLQWLAQVAHPGRKILVWGATSHLSRARHGLAVKSSLGMVPLGEHLARTMPGEVYHLGVSSYAGSIAGAAGGRPATLGAAAPGSLEELLHAAGLGAAFLDLRSEDPAAAWLSRDVSLRAMGHADVKGNWAQALDGLYFVDQCLPVRPLAR